MSEYDPKKQYTWDNNANIVIKGSQFGLILNTFRSILSTPEAQNILLTHQANMNIEAIMAKHVEEGVIKEMPEKKIPEKSVKDLEVVGEEVVNPAPAKKRPKKSQTSKKSEDTKK